MTSPEMQWAKAEPGHVSPKFDTSRPNVARFLRQAVRFLAGQAGIDQFLDIGVGLPTQGAVHEVAHEINPKSRVAYVDYDPVVVAHGNALLATPDRCFVVQEDIRQPRELLANPVIREHGVARKIA